MPSADGPQPSQAPAPAQPAPSAYEGYGHQPDDGSGDTSAGPVAFSGSRLAWGDLPRHVRATINELCGGAVVAETSSTSGFSPGYAAIVETSDGHELFVKAVSPEQNPGSPVLARREIIAAAALPPEAHAPRLLWSADDDEWVVLGFEAVRGRSPELPWRPADLTRCLAIVDELSRCRPLPGHGLGSAREIFGAQFRGWAAIRDGDGLVSTGAPGGAESVAHSAGALGTWAVTHLDALIDLEQGAASAVEGEALVHGDLRADNILLDGPRTSVIDWPHACVGAPWFDLVSMLPSVAMQGGGDAQELFAAQPLASSVDVRDLRSVLAAVAGQLAYDSLVPAPLNIPNLRAFQCAQAVEALTWLRGLS